jgi:hypothetical protein
LAALFALGLACTPACSSGDDDDGGSTQQGGFAVCAPTSTCAADDGGRVTQVVNQAACEAGDAGSDSESDAGPADFGATNCGTEADDDDCKYHAKVTATPIVLDKNVTFTVKLNAVVGGAAVTGNALNDMDQYTETGNHIGPTTATFSESTPGTYTSSPVRFDRSGRWVIRFHIREQCADTPDSPHGHVAFYVDIP